MAAVLTRGSDPRVKTPGARDAREEKTKRPRGGRNGSEAVYTEEIADEIVDRLSTGEPLNAICRDPHMPTERAVRLWVETHPAFASRYTRARDFGYDSVAEGILELGKLREEVSGPDGYVDNGEIQRLRLLSENRKWLLAKMRPKQYGDKVTQEITGEDGGALITRIELVPVDPVRKQIEHDNTTHAATPKRKRKE